MIVTIIAHIALTQIGSRQTAQQVAKPLTTQFVKRQPRLTKPLELKKRPRPKQRRIQREMIAVKARVDRGRQTMGIRPTSMVAQLARPDAKVARSTVLQAAALEPEAVAKAIEGTREPDHKMDMSLEMMDIEALDTGLYHAMVIQDPDDKRNIRGFFHVAIAYSKSMPLDTWYKMGTFYCDPYALHALVHAMNEYTDIKTDIAGTYTFDDRELFQIPFILIIANGYDGVFRISESDAENLGKYLLSGGFAFIEDSYWLKGGPSDRSLRAMQQDALAAQGLIFGRDWNFERLSHSHPVYHCYFDFAGPPAGGDNIAGAQSKRGEAPYNYLEGVTVDGRTVVIYSLKSYGTVWHYAFNGDWTYGSGIRQLQFGVNLIIFALTQEGSITTRVMDSVR